MLICKILLKQGIYVTNRKVEKFTTFSEYSVPLVFLTVIREGHLWLKDADDEQGKF